ncbi:MAG: EF-P lysine aminoacylase GenX [Gammaproteobacteria bacterium]|nr:EF-P lysine aminoacylase GenX [Gammaproteobacteria bacterium]
MPDSWQPTAGVETARRRATLLSEVHRYFADQNVLLVDTPTLGRFAASDPQTESLLVAAGDGSCRYLQTSPELFMKRLLAAGYPDIYAIAHVFRDGEEGLRHATEFTMIEWYRHGFELADIVGDTIGLISQCLERPALADGPAIVDYAAAFRDRAGIDVFSDDVTELARRAGADSALSDQLGQDRDAWLDLLLSTLVAPSFESEQLTVLQHYPDSQAALARPCPADSRLADRFEVFYGDLELANGYVELTDACEQRRRFAADRSLRGRRGQAVHAPDPQFLAALSNGLPDCAGVAVGLERLHMLYDQTSDIRDVLSFATEVPHA